MLKSLEPNVSLHRRGDDASTSGRVSEPSKSVQWGDNVSSATLSLMLSGGLAGAVSKTCTAPLARLTIMQQVQAASMGSAAGSSTATCSRAGLLRNIVQLVQREGLLSLWRGNTAAIMHRLPYSAINFYTYEESCQLLDTFSEQAGSVNTPQLGVFKRLAAGGVAGLVACTAAYPLDLVRTRLAVSACNHQPVSVLSTVRSIVQSQGIPGLYMGLGATLVQVVPSIALSFCVYESLKVVSQQHVPPGTAVAAASTLLCGSVSGFVSSSLTFPLDTIRRRLQMNGSAGLTTKMSYMEVAQVIYKQRGFAGFYSGIVPEYCKVIPGVAIAFGTYEVLKKFAQVDSSRK